MNFFFEVMMLIDDRTLFVRMLIKRTVHRYIHGFVVFIYRLTRMLYIYIYIYIYCARALSEH